MINILSWDSEFFNLTIGSIDITNIEDFENVNYDFDLIYIFSSTEIKSTSLPAFILEKFDVHLVDIKLTYIKNISPKLTIYLPEEIKSIFGVKFIEDKIFDLAVQAGEFSRFKLDRGFKNDKYKELYKLWLQNSIKGIIAEEVYVIENLNKASGVITLGIKNGISDIGIIAVDQYSRGLNMGSELLKAAEYWSFKEKCFDKIQVVTQAFNKNACNFYEKNGYNLMSKKFVYHLWKKK